MGHGYAALLTVLGRRTHSWFACLKICYAQANHADLIAMNGSLQGIGP